MADPSSRDLRNHTADALRRVERGERVRISVKRRPVAELVPLDRPRWTSGAAIERVRQEAPADPVLLEDLDAIRGPGSRRPALVHGAQVWTQDAGFTGFAAVGVVRV